MSICAAERFALSGLLSLCVGNMLHFRSKRAFLRLQVPPVFQVFREVDDAKGPQALQEDCRCRGCRAVEGTAESCSS
eukprot:s1385_g31.t1